MPDVRTWRPGWHNAGEVVCYAGQLWRCLRRTAGRPSDRAVAYWARLD
jgi:hypothetical protein